MVHGVRLVVLGKQGAGKGTQCVRLSHHYVVPHVSTGDMLRAAVKSESRLGRKVKAVMEGGGLVDDTLILEIVGERLSESDIVARGYILDGCPRTVYQAEALADLYPPELVIDIDVPTGTVLRRLADRRVCVDCNSNYSLQKPPKVNWTCDLCAGEVVQRDDDKEEAIRRRLELYELETAPLIDWYSRRDQLVRVRGTGDPDAVLTRIIGSVESRRSGATRSRATRSRATR